MKGNLTIALLLVVATLANVGVAAPTNERPLIDAGLDQTVERNTRVVLDGTGSRDPDGRIVSYRWSIEGPNGEAIEPANATRPRTSFTPGDLGRYTVTLTGVDDDGERRSDTLYVEVVRGERPTVSLSGPDRTRAGESTEYRAELSRGSAPLRRLVWRVDGEVVARRTATAGEQDSLTASFANAGSHEVSVRVVDADGLVGSANRTVRVRSRADDGTARDSGRRDSSGNPTTMAERHDPSIRGSELLTGDPPFTSTYRVDGPTVGVESVRWYVDRTADRSGRSAEIGWKPGTHRLYAVVQYTDGSTDLARFPDGSTDVVVDPAPKVGLPALDGRNGLTGRALASDGFENLRSVRVAVDGRTVERWPESTVGSRGGTVPERSLRFAVPGASVNRNHTVTVTAVDARGQQRQVSRTVSVSGEPEIVKSEFVNGPVDSYHERLDPERYTAKHVLKVDLNGVSRERIDWSYLSDGLQSASSDGLGNTAQEVSYSVETDTLKITSIWYGVETGDYLLKSKIYGDDRRLSKISSSRLVIHNSPPVLDLNVQNKDYPHQATEWNVIVDASGSFDPDGDNVKFLWRYGAVPTVADNTTAKFSVVHDAALLLKDSTGRTTRKNFDYLDYIVPSIQEITVMDTGPFRANETVRVYVRTAKYDLNKNTYSIDLEPVVSDADSSVIRWKRHYTGSDARKIRHWEGVLEIEASAFLDNSDPVVQIYNTGRPDHRSDGRRVPDQSVLVGVESTFDNVRSENVQYLLEKPVHHEVHATSELERDRYLRRGYSVADKETKKRYLIKDRVKVADAEYESQFEAFPSASSRRLFVENNPNWSAAGVNTEIKKKTVRKTEWRDSRRGKGTYLGETRQVEISPAEYRTEKRFEYTREVKHTGERTVTYWDTVTKQETYTKEVRKCLPQGCYYATQTFTRTVTERIKRSYQEEYTYTTTETEQYWSLSRYSSDHEFTGETRRIKVQDARYETQYRYRYSTIIEQQVRTYRAVRQVLVNPAQYEWRVDRTLESAERAYRVSQHDRYRIESETTTTSWDLSKQTGLTKEISSSYSDADNVIETRATVRGIKITHGLDPESGEYRIVEEKSFERIVSAPRPATQQHLIGRVVGENKTTCTMVQQGYRKECSHIE